LENLLCLCSGCHFWGHKNPIGFVEFVRGKLGEEKYELLKEKHNQITKYTIDDLQTKLDVLKDLAKP